jgi:hypothetical protein
VQNPESTTHSTENLARSIVSLSLDEGDDPISDSSTTQTENIYCLKQFSTDDLTSFTLSPAGMRFYFSPYHVGTYADGVFTVGVPYYVIRDCIPEDSPARLFMVPNSR